MGHRGTRKPPEKDGANASANLGADLSNTPSQTSTSAVNRSVFFSPDLIQGERVSGDQVSKFQDQYVSNVAALNSQNAEDYTRLPFEEKAKVSEFDLLFDDQGWHWRNFCKGAVCILLVVGLAIGVYVPFDSPSVTLALGQEASQRGISTLSKFGSEVEEGDVAQITRENPHYAQNVTLTVRGSTQTFTTTGAKVKDVLAEHAVSIGYGEGVYPNPDEGVSDGEQIIVDQITTTTETLSQEIPYTEQRVEDGVMRKGEEQVAQEGVTGQASSTFIVRMVGGNQVSRDLFSEIRLSQPQDKIIKIGTAVPVNNGTIVTVPSEDVKKFAFDQVMATWGDANEFSCLDHLWQRESGWRTTAGNIISGAYGIPQALPGSKMAQFGEDWRDNPITQVKWGLSYITGRYRTPCGAWNHSLSTGWY